MGVLLTAVGTAVGQSQLSSVVLNQRAVDPYSTWGFALSESGKAWFSYYGTDNTLYIRRPSGDEVGLGAADRQRMQSGLAMMPVGDAVTVLWRDKLPRKSLYYISQLEPTGPVPPSVIVGSEESEPLTRLKMDRSAADTEYLLWLGEKGDPADKKEKYHLYFRAVEQDGKVLSPVERVMPGRYPAWIVDTNMIPIFSWMAYEGKPAMTMRVFDRAAKSFGPLVKITDAPQISPIFEAFKSGNRWFLLWLGHYGEKHDDLLLEGVYSDDKGQTWKRFAFGELRGLDIGSVNIASDDKDHILIALDGSRRFLDPIDKKSNIYILRSIDNGATWQKPQAVRPDNLRVTKAQYPMIALGVQSGTVALAWEDWRDIRPNVYISYSKDYGATWEPALPLGKPGVWNLGLNPQPRVLHNRGEHFLLVANQYREDALTDKEEGASTDRKDFVLYDFTWEQLRQNAESFNISAIQQTRASEARLRERVSAYWQAMQENNYETAYAMMDPFFRRSRDLKTYLSNKGAIQYHRWQIGSVIRNGNIAKITLEVEASVPEFKLSSGKTISQPQKTISLEDIWVFVNEDWYREYYDEQSGSTMTNY